MTCISIQSGMEPRPMDLGQTKETLEQIMESVVGTLLSSIFQPFQTVSIFVMKEVSNTQL